MLFRSPICRYLAHEDLSLQAVADRRLPPTVLYINQERIVFGYGKNGYALQKGSEYALKLGFPLKNSPVKERTVYVTCTVQNLFASDDGARFCADCRYTSLKKEDERFLDSLC